MMGPEVVCGLPHTKAIDRYGLGAVLYQMVPGLELFGPSEFLNLYV